MKEIRAILIDDEEDSREVLKLAIAKYCPEVTLLGAYDSAEEGMAAIRQQEPDLVFLDVQMPRLSGFDLLEQLAPINFEVIFVTAHDQYAIKAIRFSALDYLLKPLDVEELVRAVGKAAGRLERRNSEQQYQSVISNMHYRNKKIERLAVPTFEGIEFFNTSEIVYCQADGNYTRLFLTGGKSQLISRHLKDFENLLTDSGFCRVHHSFLVNLRHVVKYIKGEGGYVILTGDQHVDISRRKKEEFLKLLDRL